jgi:hypothetical protein
VAVGVGSIIMRHPVHTGCAICFKDEVHCKIDDRILKNFYHHWILHLKEPGVAKISGLCSYSENPENFQLQRGDQALSQISKIFKMLIKA